MEKSERIQALERKIEMLEEQIERLEIRLNSMSLFAAEIPEIVPWERDPWVAALPNRIIKTQDFFKDVDNKGLIPV